MNKPNPPFRADHVGSLLRPKELKDAFRNAHKGELDKPSFEAIQDRCIRDAVAMQESVGLTSFTDGEFRRGSWFLGFVEAVEGLTTKDALFDFHDTKSASVSFQTAYVEGKLKRVRGITTHEYAFVSKLTPHTCKVTMPAPSLVHFFRGNESVNTATYPNIGDFWTDLIEVYRAELRELGKLGCIYVQLDEVPCAMLCDPNVRAQVKANGLDPDALLDTYIGAANAVIEGAPDGMTIAVHFCRGNYKGRWMAEGGYEPIAERLFGTLKANTLFLEYDSDRAGGFEPLRFVPRDRGIVLGLVSSKTPTLEDVDTLKRRIEEASRYAPLERLAVSPQCGFASSVGGNPVSADDQKRKLARVVEVADLVWH